jgi:hypothetical protein
MKIRVLLPAAGIGVLSSLVGLLLVGDFAAYAQRARVVGPAVKQTTSVRAVDTRGASAFTLAAAENERLRENLAWTFGAKTQTGWDIYVPLISHTIGTDAGPDTDEFAEALSVWQSRSGVPATGVLDADTLATFTRYWQSRRLGRSSFLSSDVLLSAPIADFFDPTRSPDLLQLESETYTAYKRMVAAAAKDLRHELKLTGSGELAPDEKFLRIVSAYRSREYQAALRKKQPNAGRAALAKNSPHSSGRALDIYVGGEPVKTFDSNRLIQVRTPAYRWLVKNAHKFGFYPYFYEPWHWEYVSGNN